MIQLCNQTISWITTTWSDSNSGFGYLKKMELRNFELELRNFELELKFPTKKLNPQINLPFLQC